MKNDDKEVHLLRKCIENRESTIEFLNGLLDGQSSRIEGLELEVAKYKKEMGELQEIIDFDDNEIEKLHKEKVELIKKVKKLSSNSNCLTSHLESENERLRKAVHGIYQDIKDKTWKLVVNAQLSGEQIGVLKNIFQNYLS